MSSHGHVLTNCLKNCAGSDQHEPHDRALSVAILTYVATVPDIYMFGWANMKNSYYSI